MFTRQFHNLTEKFHHDDLVRKGAKIERESFQQKNPCDNRIGLSCRGKVPLRLDSVVVYAATTSLLSIGSWSSRTARDGCVWSSSSRHGISLVFAVEVFNSNKSTDLFPSFVVCDPTVTMTKHETVRVWICCEKSRFYGQYSCNRCDQIRDIGKCIGQKLTGGDLVNQVYFLTGFGDAIFREWKKCTMWPFQTGLTFLNRSIKYFVFNENWRRHCLPLFNLGLDCPPDGGFLVPLTVIIDKRQI